MSNFTLQLQTKPVEIEQLDGSMRSYVIQEMNGRELEDYLNSTRSKVVMTDGRVTGMKSFDDLYASLLARTMREVGGDLVAIGEIRVWPAKLQKQLFEIAQDLNGLTAEGREEAKND